MGGGLAPQILNFGIRWTREVRSMPRPLRDPARASYTN